MTHINELDGSMKDEKVRTFMDAELFRMLRWNDNFYF